MSERTQSLLGFLVTVAVCGILFPALFAFWVLGWFFGFGAGPSPRWALLVYALGLGALCLLRYRHPKAYLIGAFRGAIVATVCLVGSIPLISHRQAKAASEFQRVIYRYRDAPLSVEVLDGNDHVLWRLRSKGAPLSLSLPEPTEVRYGVVPADFIQDVPASGPPRPFVVGEAIEIRVEGPRQSQASKGFARGPDRVEQLSFGGRSH